MIDNDFNRKQYGQHIDHYLKHNAKGQIMVTSYL